MQDNIKKPQGVVELILLEGDKEVAKVTKKNAIQDAAVNIIRRAIAGQPYVIDNITVRLNLVELASQAVDYDFTLDDTVIFTALFDESSFNGSFDELNLTTTYDNSIFSILSGLSMSKTNLQKIAIRWKIKFTN